MRLFAAVAPNSESTSSAEATQNELISVATADLTGPCALMVGNEGAGLSADLVALADERITIPTPGRIESLNAAVAGSLLLYEAARQRTRALNEQPATDRHQPPL
jgi:TrmH family RNA methyltransferase